MIVVFLLLAVAWAAVLVPPAMRAHAARQEAFLDSLADRTAAPPARSPRGRSGPVQRRRRIAGGLLVAMAGTLLAGLLPTFRVLLYVHLLLVDSFLAYIALLAYTANRTARAATARAATAVPEPAEPVEAVVEEFPEPRVAVPARRWRRQPALAELGPIG